MAVVLLDVYLDFLC